MPICLRGTSKDTNWSSLISEPFNTQRIKQWGPLLVSQNCLGNPEIYKACYRMGLVHLHLLHWKMLCQEDWKILPLPRHPPPPFPKNLSGRQRLEKIGAFTTKNQTVLRIRTNRSLIILDLEFISTISNCTSLNSGKIVIQDSDSATTNSGLHKKRNNHIIITNVILNDRTYQIPLTLVFG